jgi:hypothetical protein
MILQILVGLVLLVLFTIGLVFLYLLPSIIARAKNHPHQYNLCLVNIFLGWTFYGWIACIVWALWKYDKRK